MIIHVQGVETCICHVGKNVNFAAGLALPWAKSTIIGITFTTYLPGPIDGSHLHKLNLLMIYATPFTKYPNTPLSLRGSPLEEPYTPPIPLILRKNEIAARTTMHGPVISH